MTATDEKNCPCGDCYYFKQGSKSDTWGFCRYGTDWKNKVLDWVDPDDSSPCQQFKPYDEGDRDDSDR